MAAENRVRITIEADGKDAQGVIDGVRRGFRELGDDAEDGSGKARTATDSLGGSLGELKSMALGVGAAFGVAFGVHEIVQFSKELFEAGKHAKQLTLAVNEIARGAGGEELDYLRVTAKDLGQNFWTLTDSYKGFLAAAKESGLSLDATKKTFESIVAASATLGLSSDRTALALGALSQMASKGVVGMEELRQQLGDQIPGAFGMAAKAMGMVEQAFAKAVERGEVLAIDLLPRLADVLEQRFSGAVDASVAAQNKATQAWQDFKAALADGVFMDSATAGLEGLAKALDLVTAGAKAWSDLSRVAKYKDAGLLPGRDEVSSLEEAVKWVKEFESLNPGGKLAAFREKLAQVQEEIGQTQNAMDAFTGDMDSPVTLEQWRGMDEALSTLRQQRDVLQEMLQPLEKAETIQKAKEQIQALMATMHDMALSGSGDIEAVSNEILELKRKIEALTGRPYVLQITAVADTSEIDTLVGKVDALFQKTAAAKTEAAQASHASAKQMREALREVVDSNTASLRSGGLSFRDVERLQAETDKATESLRKADAVVDELFKSTPAGQLQKEVDSLRKTAAGYGTVTERAAALQRQHNEELRKYNDIIGSTTASDQEKALAQEAISAATRVYEGQLASLTKRVDSTGASMERFESQGASYLESITNQIETLQAQFAGDSLGADLARIDTRYDQLGATIHRAMIGAKGDVADYQTALTKLEESRALEKQIAEIKNWDAVMKRAAETLKELGRLTGDPDLIFGGEKTSIDAWAADQSRAIEGRYQAEAESIRKQVEAGGDLEAARAAWAENERARTGAQAELDALTSLKTLEAKRNALAGLSGVSTEYWNAERALLDEHLARVKDDCDSEIAYEAYAAKKRSDLRKAEIEARMGYQEDFLSTLQDALSLEFGLYKDAETRKRDQWVSLSREIASDVHGLSDSIASGLTDAATAVITGTGTAADAFKSMLNDMLSSLMNIIQRMIQYALENYIIIPIVESFVGSDGSGSSLTGSSGSSGSGSILSDVTGKAKDWGISKVSGYLSDAIFGGGTAALSSVAATEMAALPASAAVAGASTGYTAVTSGAAAGGALATAGETAGLATAAGLGAGLATAGIGLGIGLGIAALTGAFNTTKTETKTGSGLKIAIMGTDTSTSGADYYKVTESGMFGSSTSHEIRSTGPADPATQSAVSEAFAAYTDSLKSGFKSLGVGTGSLSSFFFPEWDVAPGQEEDFYRNVSNAMTLHVLNNTGLKAAFDTLARENEVYIDELARLSSAYATVSTATKMAGLDLERLAGEEFIGPLVERMASAGDASAAAALDLESLSGVLDGSTLASLEDLADAAGEAGAEVMATNEQLRQLALAEYASQLVEAMGGADAVTDAFNRFFTNVYSATEQGSRLMEYYAAGAGEAIAQLGDATMSVQNFWSRYREAMEAGSMSVDAFVAWAGAAKWVEAFDASTKAAAQAWEDSNQAVIDGINDQISALEKQRDAIRETLDKWSGFLDAIRELRREIKWDKDLTDLSPYQVYQEKKARFDEVAAKARTGDEVAIVELPDLTREYLDASRDYYASSEQYYSDFEHADSTLSSLEEYAVSQVDLAQAQLDAINSEIAILTLQVDQLSLVNSNLGGLANVVGEGVSAIVGAINDSSFSSSYTAAITAANEAQQLAAANLLATASGGSSSAEAAGSSGIDLSGLTGGDVYTGSPSTVEVDEDGVVHLVGFSTGGLVSGGVPGVDSVPAILTPGERVIDERHSRILEYIATAGGKPADARGIESRLDRLAATTALASRANDAAIEGLRKEMAAISSKLSRELRRPRRTS